MLTKIKYYSVLILFLASCKTSNRNEFSSEVNAISQKSWSAFAESSAYKGGGAGGSEYSGFYSAHNLRGNEVVENIVLGSNHPSNFSSVAVLRDGLDSFRARVQSLKAAKESIRIQTLIFTADESGLMIADLLKKKFAEFRAKFKKEYIQAGFGPLEADNKAYRKAQSRVKIVVDQVSNLDYRGGNFVETRNMLFDLKASGIEVRGYENLLGGISREICVRDILCLNKRSHEKLWVIDAESPNNIAIVGGLNIANEYFRADPKNPKMYWWDQDVVIKGSVVEDMAKAFDKNFNEEERKGDILKQFFDAFLSVKWSIVRTVADEIGAHFTPKPKNEFAETYLRQALPMAARLDFSPVNIRFFLNRPKLKETYIEQLYMKSIQEAQKEILINNAYFIPSIAMVNALRDAAKRGVNVKIMVNSPETNDLPEITYLGRLSYIDLLKVNLENNTRGRLEIYEWTGNSPQDSQKEGTNHAKFAVFDRDLSIVGSYNLDPRSRNLNSESVVAYQNLKLAQQLASSYIQLTKKTNLINKYSTDVIMQFLNPTNPEYIKSLKRAKWLRDLL